MATPTDGNIMTPLSFSDFLDKMKDPAAADLVRNIKGFIKRFDDRSRSHKPNLEADSADVQSFFLRMESAFQLHPAWKGSGPEVIDQAMEGLEKYVMSKIWPRTFGVSSEEKEKDERYSRLSRALSFVDLSTLIGGDTGIVPDESLVMTAVGELLRMDRYKAPRDKLLCLVNVKTVVESIVTAAVRSGSSIGGADAFFPVFLFIVIRAHLPSLSSNIEYIRRFRSGPRLSGQFDFMLCNLESAAMYLETVDWAHLKITREEFLQRLAEAGIPEAELELGIEAVEDFKDDSQQQQQQEQQADELKVLIPSSPNVVSDELTPTHGLITSSLGEVGSFSLPSTPLLLQGTPLERTSRHSTEQQHQQQLVNINLDHRINSEVEGKGYDNDVVAAMIKDGTPLVLQEESKGHLQTRHPFIYANADDLNINDVRALLARYRTLVLKYEALALILKQQTWTGSVVTQAKEGGEGEKEGEVKGERQQKQSSASPSLLEKFASWGVPSTTSSINRGTNNNSAAEAAAAVQGKGASSGVLPTSDSSSKLLYSLFGDANARKSSPHQEENTATPRSLPPPSRPPPPVDLLSGDQFLDYNNDNGDGSSSDGVIQIHRAHDHHDVVSVEPDEGHGGDVSTEEISNLMDATTIAAVDPSHSSSSTETSLPEHRQDTM